MTVTYGGAAGGGKLMEMQISLDRELREKGFSLADRMRAQRELQRSGGIMLEFDAQMKRVAEVVNRPRKAI